MARTNTRPLFSIILHITILFATSSSVHSAYFGKLLGKLSELHHGVSGEVYAIDARTLHIKDFTYDGQGPAAYFYAGNSRSPGSGGFRLRDENGSPEVIRRYRKESVTLTLPEGKTLNNIKWFSVWCEEFTVNFGDVKIPRNFDYPRPRKIDGLRGVHGVSSDNIVIVDAQTLLVPNLSYDGEAPDAKFWVGRGPKPSPQGVRVADENGKEVPLRRYDRKTVVLTLPGDLTVFDIGHFGVWCEAFTVDFGHVQIPPNLNVPPSLKMLGVSPQSKLNCEVLHEDLAFEVRWAIAGDSIVLQLVAKLDNGEYMSFGISGDETKTEMVDGDVVVAWVDKDTLKGYAEDYFLDAKSQCSGPSGSCPDHRLSDNSNNVRLLNAAMVNGYSIVTYQRPLKASDQFDKEIFTNTSQPIIWAVGPLNQRSEVSFHSHFTKQDHFVDFGRSPKWNCPMPETEQPETSKQPKEFKQVDETIIEEEPQRTTTPAPSPPSRSRNSQRRRGGDSNNRQEPTDNSAKETEKSVTRTRQSGRANKSRNPPATPAPVSKRNAWDIPAIECHEPEDGVFYAQMGPTGGKRGYPAITGHVGWGVSWYINGLLIPEINLVRGKTYNFVVEGGDNPEIAAKYHPFYITDDPIGGYEYKTPEEREKVNIYAGAVQERDGTVRPTGVGRLCHWTHQGDSEADDFESFGAYQRTLELKCDQGEPGVIQFTPDKQTPDTLYYQCYTHRYLGWKINVLDSCDTATSSSNSKESVVNPKTGETITNLEQSSDDLVDSPSIRVETKVKAPNQIEPTYEKSEIQTQETKATETFLDPLLNTYIPIQSELSIIIPQPNYFTPPIYFQPTAFPSTYNPFLYPNINFQNPRKPKFPRPGQVEFTTPPTNLALENTEKIKIEPAELRTKNNDNVLLPATRFPQGNVMFAGNKIILTRPMQSSKPLIRPLSFPILSKKPFHRPLIKSPNMNKQFPYKFQDKPIFVPGVQPQLRPQSAMLMKRQPAGMILKKIPPAFAAAEKLNPNVDISPQQPSTEKQPNNATEKPYTPIIYLTPSKVQYRRDEIKSSGFHPESVVVEGGFKPMVSKEIQDRIDQGPELEYESEIGVIDISKENVKLEEIRSFEPMFQPSPLDNNKTPTNRRKSKVMFVLKPKRNERREVEEDELAEAAERVDILYLPPHNQQPQLIKEVMRPSNIDIPPGTVVSYDGRRVSGQSLTAKTPERGVIFEGRSSKAAALIRAGPQFGPFKGDLPPLDPQFINQNAPQLQRKGVLNRDLETPPASYLPQDNPRGSTKLIRVQNEKVDFNRARRKREAHHTPEHTEEQRNNNKNNQSHTQPNSTNSLHQPFFGLLLTIMFVKMYLGLDF